jgi:hypothetical protein
LKQKIVLPGTKFEKTGRTKDVWKDGTKQVEHAFTTRVGGDEVHFTDQQGRKTDRTRIKYMEHATGTGNNFPCQSGYRHTHFTTKDDMSVRVPAVGVFTSDLRIGNILGWDESADRMLNWDIEEDRLKLEKASVYQRLYNPHPFGVDDLRHRLQLRL